GCNPEDAVRAAVSAAQDAVVEVPWATGPAVTAPACTFVAAVWDGHTITVCGIGDSRAYWIGSSTNAVLTDDDSWVQEMMDAGLLNEGSYGADPRAHVITRWLGADAPDEPFPIRTFAPGEPGQLVLCSDGLWNYAPLAPELAALVSG